MAIHSTHKLAFGSMAASIVLISLALGLTPDSLSVAEDRVAIPASQPTTAPLRAARNHLLKNEIKLPPKPATTQAGLACELRLEKIDGKWFCTVKQTNTSDRQRRLHRWPRWMTVGDLVPATLPSLPDEILADGTVLHVAQQSGDPTLLFNVESDSFVELLPGKTYVKRLWTNGMIHDTAAYRVSVMLEAEDGTRVEIKRTLTAKP